tara:strand:+ start:1919 stop:6988 length:5070 start_codon:yes stop_codon:yes gene_type:complete
MKRIILLFFGLGLAVSGWSQCSTACDASELVTWYLDIDGDGIGVDFNETNRLCCLQPSDLYVQESGDTCPTDPTCSGSSDVVKGCIYELACNYNPLANVYDGLCKFPDGCLECELDAQGNKTGEFDPEGPCQCDGTPLYYDVLETCGGACLRDLDDDGICDYEVITANGDTLWLDECREPGEALDDCGICATTATAKLYQDAEGDPCTPGTPGCTLTNTSGHCGCDGETFDLCDVCGGNADADWRSRYECDGRCVEDPNDADDVCEHEEIEGCMDDTKCNYDPSVNVSDGSCLELDACGVCGGSGIPTGDCDCDGNGPEPGYDCAGNCNTDSDGDGVCDEFEITGCTNSSACNFNAAATEDGGTCILRDELLICGGNCTADVDNDGICDVDTDGDGVAEDDCLLGNGRYDECGVCGGTSTFTNADGAPCVVGTPGCTNQTNECDCDGNTFDAMDVCGGGCAADVDGDGTCDDVDPFICAGEVDAVGVCNGTCTTDDDGDGLCDDDNDNDGFADEDPCLNDRYNFQDECGVCGGDGIPDGFCDCSGSDVDAIGVCGGTCQLDADNDGICDDDGNDPCVGSYDECGVCDGTSQFTFANGSACDPGTPGCTNAAGECNCQGDTLDALSICGGDCTLDADGDGICDVDSNGDPIDPCVGTLDACGVCNGPGEVYDCGCFDIPEEYCDCDLNVLDECDVCGGAGPDFGRDCDGNCLSDSDNDGICDVDEEMSLARVLMHEPSSNPKDFAIRLDPIKFQQVLDQFTLLHDLMSENLDDGSLTGSTRNLTIEKHIASNGTFRVKGLSTFNTNLHVKGMLEVNRNISVTGSATIGGATISEDGVVSTDLTVSGDADVQGGMQLDAQTNIAGQAAFRNSVDVSNDFRVYNGDDESTVRLKVESSTGNVSMKGDLSGASDLNVDGYTQVDGLQVTGTAVIDNATVDNPLLIGSDAFISGDVTAANSALTVDAATGEVNFGNDLEVDGNSTVIGNVDVVGNTTIGGTTFANGGVQTSSILVEGDMDVDGYGRVDMSMDVGRNVNIFKTMGVQGDFTIYNGSDAISLSTIERFSVKSATGNTAAAGGLRAASMAVTQSMQLGQQLLVSGTIDVHGTGTSIGGDLTTLGSARLDETTVDGTLDLKGALTTNGTLNASSLTTTNVVAHSTQAPWTMQGVTTVSPVETNTGLSVVSSKPDGFVAEFESSDPDGGQGIRLKSGITSPEGSNKYVSFQTGTGQEIGRIEGVNKEQQSGDAEVEYIRASSKLAQQFGGHDVWMSTVSMALALYDAWDGAGDLTAWSTSVTGCFGNGACATAPVPSLIAAAVAEIALAATGVVSAATTLGEAGNALALANESGDEFEDVLSGSLVSTGETTSLEVYAGYSVSLPVRVGVTYQSGAADYAEWLPKLDPRETLQPGQVVGFKSGGISLDTEDAQHLFVVSTLPMVLGNSPKNEQGYEKAAFLGQVPVRVRGTVHSGDCILASGRSDGYGVAVHPNDLTPGDFDRMVGMAWESGYNSFNTINVAVGLNGIMEHFAAKLERNIETMERETAGMKEVALAFVRGEEPSMEYLQIAGLLPITVGAEAVDLESKDDTEEDVWLIPGFDDIIVHQLTNDAVQAGFDEALKQAKESVMLPEVEVFFTALESDDQLRTTFLNGLKNKINDHNRQALVDIAAYQGVTLSTPMDMVKLKASLTTQPVTPQ